MSKDYGESRVESIVGEFSNGMHEQMEDARKTADAWTQKVGRYVKDNPAACLIGAFIVGFALAKVARHA